MLILKPNCERCDKDLPFNATDAMICTYECTFCKDCVETVLNNVCPNCGGGFCPRPIRPQKAYRKGVSIHHNPSSTDRVHSPYDDHEIAEFAKPIRKLSPIER